MIIQKNNPWDRLPIEISQIDHNLMILPLQNLPTLPSHNLSEQRETDYLIHFLSQPEGKLEYVLKDKSYQEKLHERIDNLMNTFQPVEDEDKMNKLVKHLYYLLVHTDNHQQNLYHQWIIKMATLTKIKNPETIKYVKELLQRVLNYILER